MHKNKKKPFNETIVNGKKTENLFKRLALRKFVLAYAAKRADKIVRQVAPFRSGRDTVFRVAA
jgi:hypothetical protein